jgi:ParB/RepB/Spo0J family partition protein
MTATFERIKVDRIQSHDRNVRRDLGDLGELAASIKAQGLLQPLVVAPIPLTNEAQEHVTLPVDRYVIVAGHRRHAAAIKAGIESVPCIVRDDLDTPAKVLEAMVVENVMRSDLTVMEEADAYQQLELLGVKETAIAKATGRSRKTVHERLLLASLPTERRQQYEAGRLSLDGAVECARLRQKYADDTEILTLIDGAGTYGFAGVGYGVKARISALLDERKRATKPPQADTDGEVDDEYTIDGAATRADREAEWERQRQEREAHQAKVSEATERMYDWASARIAVRDQVFLDRLISWAVEAAVTDSDLTDAVPLLGIDPPGEDEDVDDAYQRIATSLKALPREDQVMALALSWTSIHNRRLYWFDEHARNMAGLGYPLTADDKALMKGDDDAE